MSTNGPSPVIFGLSGLKITPEERVFFQHTQPLGFILFGRNIEDKDQLRLLTQDLKSLLRKPNPPILIDQEGGRVARLKTPHWFHPPAAQTLAEGPEEESVQRVYQSFTTLSRDLKEMGITHNCAPLLDLEVEGADPIMGDRTFSSDPKKVSHLGRSAIKAMLDSKITPIMKHLPGHGAATCDSHEELPIITLSREELIPHFIPFKANAQCPWGMTAHIVYEAIDPQHPATESKRVIQEIIRNEIGFKGFLISDDICMKALKGTFAERAERSLLAGCDAVLHCSGDMEEMENVMEGLHPSPEKRAL